MLNSKLMSRVCWDSPSSESCPYATSSSGIPLAYSITNGSAAFIVVATAPVSTELPVITLVVTAVSGIAEAVGSVKPDGVPGGGCVPF